MIHVPLNLLPILDQRLTLPARQVHSSFFIPEIPRAEVHGMRVKIHGMRVSIHGILHMKIIEFAEELKAYFEIIFQLPVIKLRHTSLSLHVEITPSQTSSS